MTGLIGWFSLFASSDAWSARWARSPQSPIGMCLSARTWPSLSRMSRPSPACSTSVSRVSRGHRPGRGGALRGLEVSSRRAWATAASVRAVAAVAWSKEFRSCAIAGSASGTMAPAMMTAVKASRTSRIRLVMARCLVGEPEAVPVDGLDQAGIAELLPQRRHVHVEHLGRAVPVLIPGALQHLLAADHPSRVAGQAFQDGELLGGHGDMVPGHGDLVGAQVDGERAVLQHLAGRLAAAAQHRPDPGQQFLQTERLDQVVVGSLVQRQHAVGFLAACRHDDDGRVAGLAQPPAHLDAVDVGQAEVEQHDIGHRPVERRLAGGDAAGFVAGPGQPADQLGSDARVIFHHEYPAKTCVHGLHVRHQTGLVRTRRRS